MVQSLPVWSEGYAGRISSSTCGRCPHRDVAAAIGAGRASGAPAVVKLAFEFLVLTAARSGEVRGAQWAEIDTADAPSCSRRPSACTAWSRRSPSAWPTSAPLGRFGTRSRTWGRTVRPPRRSAPPTGHDHCGGQHPHPQAGRGGHAAPARRRADELGQASGRGPSRSIQRAGGSLLHGDVELERSCSEFGASGRSNDLPARRTAGGISGGTPGPSAAGPAQEVRILWIQRIQRPCSLEIVRPDGLVRCPLALDPHHAPDVGALLFALDLVRGRCDRPGFRGRSRSHSSRGEARRDAPDGPDGTVSGVLFSPLAERGATRLHSPPNRQAGPRRTQRDV